MKNAFVLVIISLIIVIGVGGMVTKALPSNDINFFIRTN